MFFSSKYETLEVSSDDMSVRYFRNDIVIMFISELTQELMSVTLMFTTDVFNELVILSL